MTPDQYGPSFQTWLDTGAKRSAEMVVPLVQQLLCPTSVVDIGCGNGAWLAEFRRLGVTTIVGVDGDYVDRSSLRIEPEEFIAQELTASLGDALTHRTFDLAVCLEVAEHLPESSADRFVAELTGLAPVVLFSAAIPFQGGVGHVNEQWPDYWAGRFAAHGYQVADCIRPLIWNDPEVEFWYAQNSFLFVSDQRLSSDPTLRALADSTDHSTLARVHPAAYLSKAHDPSFTSRAAASSLQALRRVARRAGVHR